MLTRPKAIQSTMIKIEPRWECFRGDVNKKAFSLTLTLSRWERESPAGVLNFFCNLPINSVTRFFQRLNVILPLPPGEGRGEGEANLLSNRIFIAILRTRLDWWHFARRAARPIPAENFARTP